MQHRPSGIAAIALLNVVGSLFWLPLAAVNFALQAEVSRWISPWAGTTAGNQAAAVSGGYLIPAGMVALMIGLANLTVAWGTWSLRDWARAGHVAVSAVVLLMYVAGIVLLPGGALGLAGITVALLIYAGVVTYYLYQAHITDLFLAGEDQWAYQQAPGRPCPTCGRPDVPAGAQVCPFCRSSMYVAQPTGQPLPSTGHTWKPRLESQSQKQTFGAVQSAPTSAWLFARSGPNAGQQWNLRQDNNIGRASGATVKIDDPRVSRQHARIIEEGGRFFVIDVGSSTGTFVNSRQVQREMLANGSVITLGDTALEFHVAGRR